MVMLFWGRRRGREVRKVSNPNISIFHTRCSFSCLMSFALSVLSAPLSHYRCPPTTKRFATRLREGFFLCKACRSWNRPQNAGQLIKGSTQWGAEDSARIAGCGSVEEMLNELEKLLALDGNPKTL